MLAVLPFFSQPRPPRILQTRMTILAKDRKGSSSVLVLVLRGPSRVTRYNLPRFQPLEQPNYESRNFTVFYFSRSAPPRQNGGRSMHAKRDQSPERPGQHCSSFSAYVRHYCAKANRLKPGGFHGYYRRIYAV